MARTSATANGKRWERAVLAYYPFGSDDTPTVRLRDEIVTARHPGECMVCLGPVTPGTRTRALTERVDGRVGTSRFCEPCCDAMAASLNDAGEAIEKRTAMGLDVVEAARRSRALARALERRKGR